MAQLAIFGSIPLTALLFPVFFLPVFMIGLALLFVLIDRCIPSGSFSAGTTGYYILMFLSPIFYPLSAIPAEYRSLMSINPLAFIIENARELLIMGNTPSFASFLVLYISSIFCWPLRCMSSKTKKDSQMSFDQGQERETVDNVIEVKRVSKVFRIYESPKDRLVEFALNRFCGVFGAAPRVYHKEFRSLNDVSLTIKRGETVGIIGANGAGKSTLLQIICGTLSPTQGSVSVKGRVAALLELGAGFNPDFTGRDNVFISASIMGLTDEQIKARFQSILAFSEIGEFIDQPVKHTLVVCLYVWLLPSSCMLMRIY